MRALRRFTVRAVLPDALTPVAELVNNLRWSWHLPTRELFASISPELWESQGGDPGRLLGAVPGQRLAELAEDGDFLARLAAASAELHEYLTGDRWYQQHEDRDSLPHTIAYFSPEFGITEVLPQYSG